MTLASTLAIRSGYLALWAAPHSPVTLPPSLQQMPCHWVVDEKSVSSSPRQRKPARSRSRRRPISAALIRNIFAGSDHFPRGHRAALEAAHGGISTAPGILRPKADHGLVDAVANVAHDLGDHDGPLWPAKGWARPGRSRANGPRVR